MAKNYNLSSDRSLLDPAFIYKIVPANAWAQAMATGVFVGSALDLADGYIHLSGVEQAPATLQKHFAGQSDLRLMGFLPLELGGSLRWEPSRGGELFPHLYEPLRVALARGAWRADWVDIGHVLERLA